MPPGDPGPELLAVLDACAVVGAPGFQPAGKAPNYRQIRPRGWPPGLHYEFIRTADAIGVEIRVETAAAGAVASTVEAFAGRELSSSPQRLPWDPRWTYVLRLRATFALRAPPETSASAMRALIDLTLTPITLARPPAVDSSRQILREYAGGEKGSGPGDEPDDVLP